MSDENRKLSFDIETNVNSGGTFEQAQREFNLLNESALELAKSLTKAETAMTDMKSGTVSASKTLETLNKEYDELSKLAKKYAENSNLTSAQKDEYKQIQSYMASVKKDIESTQSYITKIRKSGLDEDLAIGKQSLNEVIRVNNEKVKAERETMNELKKIWQEQNKAYQNTLAQKNATSSLKDFTTGSSGLKFNESLFNTAVAVTGIDNLTGAFYNLGQEIIDIQYNLVNTQRIMDKMGDNDTRDFLLQNAADTARLTNTQITDIQEIQGAWVRVNDQYADNVELLTDITTLTAKFMNVGEIEDAEQAVALLNASLLQFNVSADEAIEKSEEFLNKWAYMADITAMGTADEYGESIASFGSVLQQMNGDMDDAIALSSALADRLAMNGKEAGVALKTFTTYMNRTKTITLFNQISEDLGDTTYQIADANGQLKDFDENLRLIAKAYQIYKESGNDVMANQILEAVGATRRRDVAMAIMSSVNEGEYDNYLEELQSANVDNYLDEQNAALMETLAASINSMKVSFQELFMVLSNNGAIQAIGLLVDGMTGLLRILADMPAPMAMFINMFVGLKVAQTAATYIGNLTGVTQKYQSLLKQGTQAEIENANSISASANAYMKRMEFMGQASQLSKEQVEAYLNQKEVLDDLTVAYNNGEITASQYSEAVTNLIGQEELNANAKRDSAQATLDKANASAKSSTTTTTEAKSVTKETTAEQQNTKAKQQNTTASNANKVALSERIKLLGKEALGYVTNTFNINKETAAKVLNNVQTTLSNTLLGKLIGLQSATSISSIVLGGTFSFLANMAGVAAVAVNGLMAALGPITAIISIGSTLFSLGSMLFGGSSQKEIEKGTQSLEDLNNELDEIKNKIKEIESLRGSSTDTTIWDEELVLLKERKKLLEENIEAQKQLVAYNNLFKDSEDSDTDNQVKRAAETSSELLNLTMQYQGTLEAIKKAQAEGLDTKELEGHLSDERRSMITLQGDAITLYEDLKEGYELLKDSGLATEEELQRVQTAMDNLNTSIEVFPSESMQLTFDMDSTIESLNEGQEAIDDLQDSMDSIFENMNESGNIDVSQINELMGKYSEFYTVANKSAQEQILFLKNLQMEEEATQIDIITNGIAQINKRKQEIYSALQNNQTGKIPMDASEIEEANNELAQLDLTLDELEARRTIYLKANLELPDLSDVTGSMQNLVSSTEDLVEAQNQLAQGTALSKQQLYELAMTYPELLYQSNLFNTSSVSGQQAAIDAVLDMKNQEFNNTIDLKIAELEAEKEYIQSIVDMENQKLQLLMDNTVEEANGEISIKGDVASVLEEYNNLIGKQYTASKQYELEKAEEAEGQKIVGANDSAEQQVNASANSGEAISQNIINAAAAGVDGMNTNAKTIGNIFSTIVNAAKNMAQSIAAALSGKVKDANTNAGLGAGSTANTFNSATYDPVSETINGLKVSDWVNVQMEALKQNIKDYKLQLGKLDIAIGNLEGFKNQGLTNVTNNLAGGSSGSGGSGSGSGSGGKSDAEKAAEEALEAIEKFFEQYIKNVEDLQSRIVKALKKQYQEQYDERKKLLEKEHNERVEQIQAEIDALNGERPQDKQSELERLQKKLEQWKNDDSTLGKQRQKEYLDQIEALEKEIKLDELNDKMDEENENYQNSIDSDSEFYDAILKKLDEQMTDEKLYREANDMIKNGKTDQIIDLLTKYDAQWDGWATLIGQTAGEIIAEEVKLAMANYKDVIDGTISADGGKNTNAIANGSTSSGSSSGGSSSSSSSNSSGSVKKGSKVKISNTSAGMYREARSSSAVGSWKNYTGTYYVVNDVNGRAALSRTNNISGAIGWIDKKYLVGLKTGGETGNREGLAMLHKKERVLNSQQTAAFDKLVYDFLPRISDELLNLNGNNISNDNSVVFQKELVSVKVDKVINNTPYDQKNGEDNLDRMLRKSLQKSGINLKR